MDQMLDGEKVDPTQHKDSIGNFFRHAHTTGISHDQEVLRVKWFMVITSTLYLFAQVPAWIYNDDSVTQQWSLYGSVACLVMLVVYLIDSSHILTSSDEDAQKRHLEKVKAKADMKRDNILKAVAEFDLDRTSDGLVSPPGMRINLKSSRRMSGGVEMIDPATGVVHRESIGRMFDVFDVDKSGFLDEVETDKFVKVVFMTNGETEVPDEVLKEVRKAQLLSQVENKNVDCCTVKNAARLEISREAFLDSIAELLENQYKHLAALEVPEVVPVEEEGNEPGMSVLDATAIIIFGTVLATLFSDTLVDAIDELCKLTGIPNFAVAFVVCPFASNASELLSSFQLASRKKLRNASVTFAQIYAACTMNNCLGLGVFLFMIWYKRLSWNYGAEVSSIILVTWFMAFVTCNETTIYTRMVVTSLALYPLSLAFVEGMHRLGVA